MDENEKANMLCREKAFEHLRGSSSFVLICFVDDLTAVSLSLHGADTSKVLSLLKGAVKASDSLKESHEKMTGERVGKAFTVDYKEMAKDGNKEDFKNI